MITYSEARQLVDHVCRVIPEPPRINDQGLRRQWERLLLDAAHQLARAARDAGLLVQLADDEYGLPPETLGVRRILLRMATLDARLGSTAVPALQLRPRPSSRTASTETVQHTPAQFKTTGQSLGRSTRAWADADRDRSRYAYRSAASRV
ncbi:hypothetical protein [Jatrophihabitans sp.]|uniref:hypothetical protein n=1 Tax=Jatrophihabitans sp. TaxID=1932789 RepID=UPI0030C76D4B